MNKIFLTLTMTLVATGCSGGDQQVDSDASSSDAGSISDGGPTVDSSPGDATTGSDAGASDGGTTNTEITCSNIVRLDTFDQNSARSPKIAHSGDHLAVVWEQRGTIESVSVARYNFATDTWSAPFDVFSQTNPPFSPIYDVAIDSDGDVTSIYRTIDVGQRKVWARSYAASTSSWGAEEAVYVDGNQPGKRYVRYDRNSGVPMVILDDAIGGRRPAFFVERNANGTWTAPVTLGPPAPASISDLFVRVNDAGQAIVAWTVNAAGGAEYHLLPYDSGDFRRDGSNNIEALKYATNNSNASSLHLSQGADGAGQLSFNNPSVGSQELIATQFDPPDTLSAPATVVTGTSLSSPRSAIGVGGEAVMIWAVPNGPGSNVASGWVSTLDSQGWSTPFEFGSGHASSSPPQVDTDSSGRARIVSSSGAQGIYVTRNATAGGVFPVEVSVGGPGASGDAQVVAHDSGDFVVVWAGSFGGGDFGIHAARCK